MFCFAPLVQKVYQTKAIPYKYDLWKEYFGQLGSFCSRLAFDPKVDDHHRKLLEGMATKLADALNLIRLGKSSYGLSDLQMGSIAAGINGIISSAAASADAFEGVPSFAANSRVYNETLTRYIQFKTANDIAQFQGSESRVLVSINDSTLSTRNAMFSPHLLHSDGAATGAGKGGATKRAAQPKAQDGGRATVPKTRDGQAARGSRFAGQLVRPGFKTGQPLAHSDPQLPSQERSKYFLCQYFDQPNGCRFGDSCRAIHVHRECYQYKDKSYVEAQHKAAD